MTTTLIHPTHRTLVRFSCGDASDAERRRVGRHLQACSRCRDAVTFARDMAAAAATRPVPAPGSDLLQRVLADRAAGDRIILPTTEAMAPRGNRAILTFALAAAMLLLMLGIPIRNASRRPDPTPAAAALDTASLMQALLERTGFFATAANAQGPPPTVLPHVPPVTGIDGTRLHRGEMRYEERWTDSAGRVRTGGRQWGRVTQAELAGRAAWRLEHRFTGAGLDGVSRTEAETLWVDHRTLQPLQRRVHVTPFANYARLDISQSFNGDSLVGRVTAWSRGMASFERTFLRRLPLTSAPRVTDALSPLFLSSVTLGPRWEGSIAVVGWAVMERDVLHPVTLRVMGAERVTVPAGSFDCWRVVVSMDGHEYLAWVRQSDGVGIRTRDESARSSRGVREVVLVGG